MATLIEVNAPLTHLYKGAMFPTFVALTSTYNEEANQLIYVVSRFCLERSSLCHMVDCDLLLEVFSFV